MFKNPRFAWLVALIAVVVAVGAVVQAGKFRREADVARGEIAARERLARLAQDFQPARFIRVTDRTIVYGVPRQVTVDGQTFVDYAEESAAYNADEIAVFGAVGEGPTRELLDSIPEGADISVDVIHDNAEGLPRIVGLYVAP